MTHTPDNSPSFFPELNFHTLQGLARDWAQDFPVIRRISLYRGNKKTVSVEYVILVHIHQADDKSMDYLNWAYSDAGHVIDSLKSAYIDKPAGFGYLDEWAWYTESIEDPLPIEFILQYPHWVLFEAEALGLQTILAEAKPEVEELYTAIKGVGFSGLKVEAAPEQWKRAALECFDNHPHKFSLVKLEYLEKDNLYAFSPGQEARDFKGSLLKMIAEEKGFTDMFARPLYEQYKRI